MKVKQKKSIAFTNIKHQGENNASRDEIIMKLISDNSCAYRAIAIGITFYKKICGNREPTEVKNLHKTKDWRQIIQYSGYSPVHQKRAAEEVVRGLNRIDHSDLHHEGTDYCSEDDCQRCLDLNKCLSTSDCGFIPTWSMNHEFGSRPQDFDDVNYYLNTLGLSLQVFDQDDQTDSFYEGIRLNPNYRTIHLDCNRGQYNFIRSMAAYKKRDHYCHYCRKAHNSMNHICL